MGWIMDGKIDNAALRSRMQAFAASHADIAAAYLFGSAATGRMRSASDLDIAVVSFCSVDGFERLSMETELSNHLGRDVDLVIFHQAGVLLQHQILKYGYLIFEGDPRERIRQETFSRREYLDTRHLYKTFAV
jgi:uncharacterized protein